MRSLREASPIGNQAARSRRQAVRVYKLHADDMTVREIAELIGKQPNQVSQMVKVGERFADMSTAEQK